MTARHMPWLRGIWGVTCKSPKELHNILANSFVSSASQKIVSTCRRCQAFLLLPLERNVSRRLALMLLFLIKQPCFQALKSDHDVLIRFTWAGWHWQWKQRCCIFSLLLPLLHFHFCTYDKEYIFQVVCVSLHFFFFCKTFSSVWRKCCLGAWWMHYLV